MHRRMQVPFNASSMGELRQKVAAGRYAPIKTAYSPALKTLCQRMLTVDVQQRVTIGELLASPEVQQRLPHLPGALEADQIAPMLGTIVVPKNLKQLDGHLPAATYDVLDGALPLKAVPEGAVVGAYDAISAAR